MARKPKTPPPAHPTPKIDPTPQDPGKQPRKTRAGRPARIFTRQEIQLVDQMVASGATQPAIAKALGCSLGTVKNRWGKSLKGRQRTGPRPRIWTDQERELVELAVGVDIPAGDVALILGVTMSDLQLHFAPELARAKASLHQRLAQRIIKQALRGDRQLLIFLARSRMGWDDRQVPAPPPSDPLALLRGDIRNLDAKGQAALRVVMAQMGAVSALGAEGPGPDDVVQ
jgi:DNA-binding CsgD family transcriptional regulator